MAEETITILRVGTDEAVRNIADLKANIKALKEGFEDAQGTMHKGINDLEIGTQEYQDALEELKVNQAALKDAMYATTASMEDVAKAATGTGDTYNALVHKMAALKEEFRATGDAVRRAELGKQINGINQQLKEMDAMQGNFQRNVGNYRSVLSGLGDGLDAFRKGVGAATGGLNGMKDGVEALQKSPAIATFSILVSIFLKLADELKENETAMAGLKKAMSALQPVMDFISGIVEKLAEFLADIIVEVTEFVTSNGLIQKIINGVMGVGNAILQFIIAPFKGVVAAIKVFKEQGVKGIGEAAKAFGDELKSGVSFKQNFQAGQAIADTIISGAKSRKKEVKDTGKELVSEIEQGVKEKLPDVLKLLAEAEKKDDEARKRRLDEQKELDALTEAEYQSTLDSIEAYFEEQERLREQDLKDAQEKAKAKIALLSGVASATSSILGTIADIYEEDEENSEKNANKIKNLRIASATIDTISGAIGAYMQAAKTIPPPMGIITGAVQAAAVTAAGIAEIAKIKSTKVSGSSSPASVSIPAVSSAPTLTTEVSQVRSVTSASEEDRLNQMAREQRVYILASDIEASQDQIKTQVAESSF